MNKINQKKLPRDPNEREIQKQEPKSNLNGSTHRKMETTQKLYVKKIFSNFRKIQIDKK